MLHIRQPTVHMHCSEKHQLDAWGEPNRIRQGAAQVMHGQHMCLSNKLSNTQIVLHFVSKIHHKVTL